MARPAGEISLTPPDLNFQISNALFFYGFLVVSLLTLLGTAWLTRTRFGYALVAIRENEQAAESLGIATYWYKVGAFVLSAIPTAIAAASSPTGSFRSTPSARAAPSTSRCRWR